MQGGLSNLGCGSRGRSSRVEHRVANRATVVQLHPTSSMATKRKKTERTYRVEVDHGSEWRWDEEFKTLAEARREYGRLLAESDVPCEMHIIKVTREVVR